METGKIYLRLPQILTLNVGVCIYIMYIYIYIIQKKSLKSATWTTYENMFCTMLKKTTVADFRNKL